VPSPPRCSGAVDGDILPRVRARNCCCNRRLALVLLPAACNIKGPSVRSCVLRDAIS
jgi:hypothetical protein